MPVSLSEWRVRIGTFVHWIREYEVKERRERLLKERIRRLKVLCDRLEAKLGDSGEESEDDKSRQDGPDPKGCPHKTANIRSSGNTSHIKDLLTSCDQCIQDLLTASDSHIKEILTSSDACIKQLLTPRRERLQRIQRLKVLCERLEAKMGDSGEESEDDKSRQDGPDPKGCPHKNSNIRSSGNTSDIKDLLTSCDQCIQELLKASDSHIKEILTPSDTCIKQLLTPTDSNIRHLLSLTNSCRKDQHIACDSYVEDLTTCMLTPNYSNIRELIIHSDSNVKDLLTPRDSAIIEILQPKDYCTNRLLTPRDSYIKESLTPRDSCIQELLTPRDSYIQETFTSRDSYTSESLTAGDSFTNTSLRLGDSYIQELLTPRDSHTNELLTPTDAYANEPLTPGDIYYSNTSLTPGDSYIQELLAPRDSDIRDLLTPTDSYANESLTPGDSYTQDLLTPRDSDIRMLLTPRDVYTNLSIAPGESYIQELLTTQGHSYTNTSLTGDKLISPTSGLDRDAVQHGPSGGKEMANTSSRSTSLCHKTDKGTVDVMLSQQPYLTVELLLVKAGDVELNPGPLHGPIDSVLQEIELIRLAEEVPVDCYYKLCTGLGFSLTQSQTVLTQHHLNIPGALIELFCGWKVKQRDGTNCRALLGEILKNADMGALQTKLLGGEYLTSGTSQSEPILDTSQTIMTEAQVLQCGEELKTFYSEQMCKIKPDPLEFGQIYTNLTLLRNKVGTRKTLTPLNYTDLFTTKINGVLPKRLLVEGEGGVGKTTFCSKIAWDWVNGSPELQQFNWVLVIPLDNVGKGQTIGDLMKSYLSDSNAVNPKQIDNYISSQPTKVLIVLDGLDEYDGDLSAKESSDIISQILQLEKFEQCIVLVTTRPWRAEKIKSNEGLSRSYAFIAVEGFSAENVTTYISKYFVNDEKAGSELSRFIEVNDVIKENMAPFPIYVAMLCILWENCYSEKQETIRRLKTFSQLFDQMIMSLRDHYVSKVAKVLHEAHLAKEKEKTKLCFQRIGAIAFSGLLKRTLIFNEEDFSSCKEAMETCCRIGVLSRENRNESRWKRSLNASKSATTSVFFPHKLFQEYIASVYLASLYDTNREEYSRSIGEVLSDNPQEFRYLLYFTAAMEKGVGLDIVKKIQQKDFRNVRQRRRNNDFLADVTFEAYNNDTAKAVGQQIFADGNKLTFDNDKPDHTVSGYLFILEQHGMETLVFRDRSCDRTVSRDLADVLFTSNSLTRLLFYRTTLDDDFYQLMHTHFSSMAGDKSSIKELDVDHQFLNGLERFNNGDMNATIGNLFPSLTQLTFTTRHTVSPGDVERLAHSTVAVLSIEHGKKGENLFPLIGEPTSLGQLFSSSFPKLTRLTFRGLVMGNTRSEAILHNLKNHLCLKSISIIKCFTDDELDPLAEQINTENRMKITLRHDTAQRKLSCGSSIGPLTIDMIDALCHRTCVRQWDVDHEKGVEIADEECFPDLHGREVDSKIHTLTIARLQLHDNELASCCLGKFVSLLPHLADLKIHFCFLHDDFYKEIADRASSSQIQTVNLDFSWSYVTPHEVHVLNRSASKQLAKFLCRLPCLTTLTIKEDEYLHGDLFTELDYLAASSQNPYFREKKHIKMLQEWSERKYQLEQLEQWERLMASTHQSANSSSQETQQHSPHHGLGEATQDTAVSQRQEDATPIETDDALRSSSSEYIDSRTSVYQDDSSATGHFGAIGGELSTKYHGFTLHIPPGALEEDKQISLQVLTEIPNGLTLKDDEILVSHGFQCYPSGLSFKKPAKLIIPHCALVTEPNKVQTILYSWNQSGTPKRLQHSSDITCSVQERWLEISISHFSGGFFACCWDWLYLKGILLSCMSFLPSVLPPNRQPLLEVRFVKNPHGQKWNNIHVLDDPRVHPVKGDDDVIVFRRSTLTVSCQLEGNSPETRDIQHSDMSLKPKETKYFRLDLTDESDETSVTLNLVQTTTQTILLDINFPAQLSSVNQSLQSGGSIHAENSSRVTDNTIIGQQNIINLYGKRTHSDDDKDDDDEEEDDDDDDGDDDEDDGDDDEEEEEEEEEDDDDDDDDGDDDGEDEGDRVEESPEQPPRKRRAKTDRQPTSP